MEKQEFETQPYISTHVVQELLLQDDGKPCNDNENQKKSIALIIGNMLK